MKRIELLDAVHNTKIDVELENKSWNSVNKEQTRKVIN